MMQTDGQRALEAFGRSDRRARKMNRIDALPAELKAVVHDFGWLTVKEFTECGVTSAKKIRHLIHIVLFEHSHEYRSRYEPKKHD